MSAGGRTSVRFAVFWLSMAIVAPLSAQAETRAFAVVTGNNAGSRGRAPLRYAETDAGKVARTLTEVAGVREDDIALVQGRSSEPNWSSSSRSSTSRQRATSTPQPVRHW